MDYQALLSTALMAILYSEDTCKIDLLGEFHTGAPVSVLSLHNCWKLG